MGALQSKRNRSLDSVWTSNKDIIAVLEAMMGVSIGTDNGPLFIQDAGQKIKDRVYVDKNTGKMYRCNTANSDIENNSKYTELNITFESDYLRSLRRSKRYILNFTPGGHTYFKLGSYMIYSGMNNISIRMDAASKVFCGGCVIQTTSNAMTWESEKVLVPMDGYTAGTANIEVVDGSDVPGGGVIGHKYLKVFSPAGGPSEASMWVF